MLLRGTVVTPTEAFLGEVLVQGDTIVCAAVSCAGEAGASTASIVETNGLIYPGLIDAHNYVLFDIFDQDDWYPTQLYSNHNVWANDPRYKATVDAKQYLNGEGTSTADLGCEMDKYGELKALLAGTTSIVTSATPASLQCYGSLARTIDQTPNDLGADYIQVSTVFPSVSGADSVCANFVNESTHAYIINIAEGVDATALNEFGSLGTISTTDFCLYAPQTAIAHGTALGDAQFTTMGNTGMSLVWQPRSDMALYGATANVPLARSKGVNVALGTNWSLTGSHNMLDALRDADQVDNTTWGNALSAYDLVQMATTQAARALALDDVLGSIGPGKKADLMVVDGSCSSPWSTLVAARPRNVRLVLVGGVALYGDPGLQAVAPAVPACETINVCGSQKFACVAESGGTTINKLGQTLAEITSALSTGLSDYDALDLSGWDFSPITPLVTCP